MESKTSEAKAYLKQYLIAKADVDNIERQLEKLRTEAEGITSRLSDACVQTSKASDRIGDMASEIADMTIKTMDYRTIAHNTMHDVMSAIRQVNDADLKKLLYMRYIDDNTWEEIAVSMHYSFRWVLTLHGRALVELDKIINKSY